jgi:hypothetical protein
MENDQHRPRMACRRFSNNGVAQPKAIKAGINDAQFLEAV